MTGESAGAIRDQLKLDVRLVWDRSRDLPADLAVVGGKAFGLCRVPSDWTPPFFVLQVDTGEGGLKGAHVVAEALSIDPDVELAIDELWKCSPNGFMIRSSALVEDLAARGAFVTAVAASRNEVLQALAEVVEGALLAPEFVGETTLPVIVQQRVVARRSGHFANTRRVSRDGRTWRLEIDPTATFSASSRSIRADRTESRPDEVLGCGRAASIAPTLRRVAAHFGSQGPRSHCEWVWDGTSIFVVQADREITPVGPRPGSAGVSGLDPIADDLEAFVEATRAGSWPKIDSVRTFARCGLSHGSVFVLEGANVPNLEEGLIPDSVKRDLGVLTSGPCVIRSDVRTPGAFLLPRTEARLTLAEASEWLVDAAQRLRAEGVESDALAFIVHRFIPAHASAWSLAVPGHPSVRIDGTWGLPDGLLYYPHDSFEVDLAGNVVDRKIRCKSLILDFDGDGRFYTRPAERPWDWKPSLTPTQLRKISAASMRIADELGTPVETMFFVGVPKSLSDDGILPWFCTTEISTGRSIQRTESHFGGSVLSVMSRADVAAFRERAKTDVAWASRVALRLEPEADLLRNKDFFNEIADTAEQTGCHVEFNGSVLSHAYAMLVRRGVSVRAFDPFDPRGSRLRFDKLVRDNVPREIEARGERVSAVSVSSDRLERLLVKKLVEEVIEVRGADAGEPRLEELADVLEVVSTLARRDGESLTAVVERMERKRQARGGFAEGMLLQETELASVVEVAGTSQQTRRRLSSPASAEPRLSRPHRRTGDAPRARVVLPIAAAVMGDDVERFQLPLGVDELAEVAYFADRIEISIWPRAAREVNPDQLVLRLEDD